MKFLWGFDEGPIFGEFFEKGRFGWTFLHFLRLRDLNLAGYVGEIVCG